MSEKTPVAAGSSKGRSVPKLNMGAVDSESAVPVAAGSPVERGDISPTTGQLTFELLPAAVVDGKPKNNRRRRTKRGVRRGGRGRKNNSPAYDDESEANFADAMWSEYAAQVALPSPDVVRRQLEFRFSPEMMSSETFLRRNMDQQGWVPVWIIAQLGEFAQWGPAIFDVLRAGLEASEYLTYDPDTDLARLATDWQKWLFPLEVVAVAEADEGEEGGAAQGASSSSAAEREEDALWGSQWHVFGTEEDEEGQGGAAEEEEVQVAVGTEGEVSHAPALRATATEWVPSGVSE